MQNNMKTQKTIGEREEELLKNAEECVLATLSPDGFPYAIPMSFVYFNNKIYMHCACEGKKTDNIKVSPKVCLEVHETKGLSYGETDTACSTGIAYRSVILLGYAGFVEDCRKKEEILSEIVKKYTPEFSEMAIPDDQIQKTCIIEVDIKECTGKYRI